MGFSKLFSKKEPVRFEEHREIEVERDQAFFPSQEEGIKLVDDDEGGHEAVLNELAMD